MFGILTKFREYAKKYAKISYRKRVASICRSYEEPLKVNYPTYLTPNTILGKNCNFNGLRVSGGGTVKIGNNFHSGRECLFITQNHNYDTGKEIPYDSSYILKNITIEDNVWMGDRVIVLGGVTIGEGAIIQAGAVVVKSIPKYGIAGGNPATVFKSRDAVHYETLKAAGKFH